MKAGVWVKAQIRTCDLNCIPAVISRRGDPDAGSVLLKLIRPGAGCEVFSQVRTGEGRLGWMRGTGAEPVPETDADAYIERQAKFDPDLWVVEIEDTAGSYQLDGEIVS